MGNCQDTGYGTNDFLVGEVDCFSSFLFTCLPDSHQFSPPPRSPFTGLSRTIALCRLDGTLSSHACVSLPGLRAQVRNETLIELRFQQPVWSLVVNTRLDEWVGE